MRSAKRGTHDHCNKQLKLDMGKISTDTPVANADRELPAASAKSKNKLCEAARKGNLAVLQDFIATSAEPAEEFGSLMLTAAGHGQLKVVQLLLKGGADVHHKSECGRDALDEALDEA